MFCPTNICPLREKIRHKGFDILKISDDNCLKFS